MCLYPKLIKNRKYIANKKNGGNIPEMKDKRVMWVPVGCGKCKECVNQKSRAWSIRLQEEIRVDKRGKFITFSFSDEELNKLMNEVGDIVTGYNKDNAVAKMA